MKKILSKVVKWYLLETACFLIVSVLVSAVPYIEKEFIESFMDSNLSGKRILLLILAFAAIVLLYLFFDYFGIVFVFKGSAGFEREVRNKCFSNLLRSGTRACGEEEKDNLIQAMTAEIGQLDSDLIRSYICIIQSVLQIVVYALFIFFFIDRAISGIVLALGLLGVFLSRFLNNDASRKRDAYLQENKLYIGFLRQILSGLSIVRQNNRTNIVQENQKRTRSVAEKRLGFGKAKALLLSLTNGISYFILLLFFICVVLLAYHGSVTIAVALISFEYIDLVMEPINAVFDSIANIKTVKGLREKFEVMLSDKQGAQYVSSRINQIAAEDVSYAVEQKLILKPITEHFDTHNQYLVEGINGSGKSTFLKLLANILHPTGGTLKINDNPVLSDTIYNDLYYVNQDAVVFPTSFSDNVTVFGAYDIQKLDKFRFYHSDFAEKIKCCPNCQVLSGGEKQFLSLCRALICGAAWLLLDESFSSMAQSLEKSILQEIIEKEYHIIYVTHSSRHIQLFTKTTHVTEPNQNKGDFEHEI